MDTIKILLSLTVALLLGALAMTWKDFRKQERETPKEELAEVRRQIEEIKLQQERLRMERDRVTLGTPADVPSKLPDATPPPATPPVAAESIPDNLPVPEFADFPDETPPPAPPSTPDMEARAQAIKDAPVVARITEWVTDPQIGSFATIEIVDAASVPANTVLCLRRNSGILGRLKVNEISPEGAIAGAVSKFGAIKPEAGDELILEPK
ncbi:hypothetical protein [Luteolibacter marinus]|uniref:hypothetical protein n=1 Tax=Luteolibacter marinus TaxID=2776705 RepID=UPI00186804F1|nr:hypothetical protein [Luteolibacter marinus]